MARMIQVMAKLAPRLELGPMVEIDELCEILASRTGLHKGQVLNILSELEVVTGDLARRGRPVKLQGLGVFTPALKITGRVHMGYRVDRRLNRRLATEYRGEIRDGARLEWVPEDYRRHWDALHPDDPVDPSEVASHAVGHLTARERDERYMRGVVKKAVRRRPSSAGAQDQS